MKTPLTLTLLLLGALAATPSSTASEIPWPGGQTPDVQCMEYYSQTYLGEGYWLVRRDSCSAQLYECPEGYRPPSTACEEASLLEAESSAAAPVEPQCMYVYRETEVGPVTQVSRDTCHSETYVCDDDDGRWEQEETVGAFVGRQVAEPGTEETQECVDDFLGESIAWG
jgi:hypothetical protein